MAIILIKCSNWSASIIRLSERASDSARCLFMVVLTVQTVRQGRLSLIYFLKSKALDKELSSNSTEESSESTLQNLLCNKDYEQIGSCTEYLVYPQECVPNKPDDPLIPPGQNPGQNVPQQPQGPGAENLLPGEFPPNIELPPGFGQLPPGVAQHPIQQQAAQAQQQLQQQQLQQQQQQHQHQPQQQQNPEDVPAQGQDNQPQEQEEEQPEPIQLQPQYGQYDEQPMDFQEQQNAFEDDVDNAEENYSLLGAVGGSGFNPNPSSPTSSTSSGRRSSSSSPQPTDPDSPGGSSGQYGHDKHSHEDPCNDQ